MEEANNPKHLRVAVGVILNQEGKVLVALRSSSQDQGELWEFPGGKVEANESYYQALCRELKEEVAIEVQKAEPLVNLTHQYTHYRVELDTWIIRDYQGIPRGAEGQSLKWVNLQELKELKLPGANWEIVAALQKHVD